MRTPAWSIRGWTLPSWSYRKHGGGRYRRGPTVSTAVATKRTGGARRGHLTDPASPPLCLSSARTAMYRAPGRLSAASCMCTHEERLSYAPITPSPFHQRRARPAAGRIPEHWPGRRRGRAVVTAGGALPCDANRRSAPHPPPPDSARRGRPLSAMAAHGHSLPRVPRTQYPPVASGESGSGGVGEEQHLTGSHDARYGDASHSCCTPWTGGTGQRCAHATNVWCLSGTGRRCHTVRSCHGRPCPPPIAATLVEGELAQTSTRRPAGRPVTRHARFPCRPA